MDYGLERAFYNLSEQLEHLTADSVSSDVAAASASESPVAAGTGAGSGALDIESELDLSGTGSGPGAARASGSTLASLRSAASLSYPRFKFLLAAIAACLGTLLAFPGAALFLFLLMNLNLAYVHSFSANNLYSSDSLQLELCSKFQSQHFFVLSLKIA